MRFTITSQGAGMPLQLDISGYILTVSDISEHSISVSDTDGRLAVCFTKQDALLQPVPVSAETAPVEQVAEVAASQAAIPVIEQIAVVDTA
uniref:hypothetical protein n=1 Tax=Ruminiclostridium cellobioparum TaxID=29355 RepID=UPI0005579415